MTVPSRFWWRRPKGIFGKLTLRSTFLPADCCCKPFPSVPMLCLVAQPCPTFCDPVDCSLPDSSVAHQAPLSMGFSRPEYWSGLPCPPPGDRPNPGIEPRSHTLQVDSLLSVSPGKPKNTGVGSLSLLQWNFLAQESNQDLLHCRWILY